MVERARFDVWDDRSRDHLFWGPPQPSFEAVALGPAIDRPLPDYGGKTARGLNTETAAINERYLLILPGLGFVFIGFGCQLVAVWPGCSR